MFLDLLCGGHTPDGAEVQRAFSPAPVERVIGGKWKGSILWHLKGSSSATRTSRRPQIYDKRVRQTRDSASHKISI